MTKESLQNFRYTVSLLRKENLWIRCKFKIFQAKHHTEFRAKPGESGQPGELMKKIKKREFRVCSAANLRSSPREMLLGKGILKICSKFTGEHQC